MFESMDKKKLIILGSSLVGFIVVILLASWIISIVKPHYYTYEEVETKITAAVKSYYETNPTMIPTQDGEYSVQYSTLVEGEFIKPLNEILKDGDNCTVNIVVTKSGDNIAYLPYLTCPGSYETKELYKVVKENNPVVTYGTGLYENTNGGYYFRGEVKNNYISFGEISINDKPKPYLWKILSIESDNTIKIMTDITERERYAWDDRFNEGKQSNFGYNDFEISRAKETLKSFESNDNITNESMKNAIVAKNLCIGKRKISDTTKDGSAECSVMSEDKYMFGLITPYEYMRISLDDNCKVPANDSCSNYNYMYNKDVVSWSLTAEDTSDNNYSVYYFDGTVFETGRASIQRRYYVTTYINARALFKSGNGTVDDPYIIR